MKTYNLIYSTLDRSKNNNCLEIRQCEERNLRKSENFDLSLYEPNKNAELKMLSLEITDLITNITSVYCLQTQSKIGSQSNWSDVKIHYFDIDNPDDTYKQDEFFNKTYLN